MSQGFTVHGSPIHQNNLRYQKSNQMEPVIPKTCLAVKICQRYTRNKKSSFFRLNDTPLNGKVCHSHILCIANTAYIYNLFPSGRNVEVFPFFLNCRKNAIKESWHVFQERKSCWPPCYTVKCLPRDLNKNFSYKLNWKGLNYAHISYS